MTVRVVLQGFGAMGRGCATTLLGKSDAEIVAVLDPKPGLVGRRVGDMLTDAPAAVADLRVQHPDQVDIAGLGADVAVHTSTAFLHVAAPQIIRLLTAGLDVVSICQELVFPIGANLATASRLDAVARSNGRRVVSGGVNPGWILDALVVAATLGCARVDAVRATRVVDFSPYGPDEMSHIGAGLDPQAFERGVRDGTIGHIGLLESGALIAAALGLDIDTWEQRKDPVLAEKACQTPFITIDAGHVRGFMQTVVGRRDDRPILELHMIGLLSVNPDDEPLGDRFRITGSTSLEVHVNGDDTTHGGTATAGVACNLIGPLLNAQPGLHTVLDLPLTRSRNTLRLPPPLLAQASSAATSTLVEAPAPAATAPASQTRCPVHDVAVDPLGSSV